MVPTEKFGTTRRSSLHKFNVRMSSTLEKSITPARDQFRDLAKRGNLIPLMVDLVADVETAVSAFAKIDNGEPCFLFESAERNEELGRFSFIGFDPLTIFNSADCQGDPLSQLQQTLAGFRFVAPADVPHFVGGAVGYIGYDVVRFFEPTVPIHSSDDLKIPEMVFMIPRMLLVFDHRFRRLRLICNAYIDGKVSPDQAYEGAVANLTNATAKLNAQRALKPIDAKPAANLPLARKQHDTGRIRVDGGQSEGADRRRRYFSGCAFATLRNRIRRRAARSLSRSSVREPFALHVLPALRSKIRGSRKFTGSSSAGARSTSQNCDRSPELIRAERIQPKMNASPAN